MLAFEQLELPLVLVLLHALLLLGRELHRVGAVERVAVHLQAVGGIARVWRGNERVGGVRVRWSKGRKRLAGKSGVRGVRGNGHGVVLLLLTAGREVHLG